MSPEPHWRDRVARLGLPADAGPVWADDLDQARLGIVVVDVVRGFVESQRGTAADGLGAGDSGVVAVAEIVEFLEEARGLDQLASVVFSRPGLDLVAATGGTVKRDRLVAVAAGVGDPMLTWAGDIRPEPTDLVLDKAKPSAFFGTALVPHLVRRRVDTVVVVGCTTSGCVRATATDAFSHGFRVIVADDCVFDNAALPGAISLHDLSRKYADVLSWREILRAARGGVVHA